MYRNRVQYFGQGVVLDALLKFLFGNLTVKAIIQISTRLAVQHIPHFRFPVLVLIF